MSYFDDFKTVTNSNGSNNSEYNLEILQQGFDNYFNRTPDKVTGTIDGVSKSFVLQNIKYGENFNDEKLLLAPTGTSISIGSLIVWDGKTWLTINEENRAIDTHLAFKIHLCNNSLKWKSTDGIVKTTPCVFFDTGLGYSDSDMELKQTVTRREIHVQYNADTTQLYENQRFIFGHKRSFVVTDIDDYTRPEKMIVLRVEKDLVRPEDDLVNNIAYNGIISENPTTTNGVFFTSESLVIPEGLTKTIEVYEYLLSIPQSTAFTFRIDGVPVDSYTVIASTSNSISIKCDKYYYQGFLVAIKPDLSETQIPLTLKSIV